MGTDLYRPDYGDHIKEGPHPYECCDSLNIGPCCCDLYGWYECTLWGDNEPPAD